MPTNNNIILEMKKIRDYFYKITYSLEQVKVNKQINNMS